MRTKRHFAAVATKDCLLATGSECDKELLADHGDTNAKCRRFRHDTRQLALLGRVRALFQGPRVPRQRRAQQEKDRGDKAVDLQRLERRVVNDVGHA
jgi:hypothetical protein